jgi:hypothetical protein
MNASAILDHLASRGVEVSVVGDKLRFRPASKMSPDLVETVRRHKPAIVARLRETETSGFGRLLNLAGSGQTILPEADDCDLIPIGSAWSCPKCGSYEAWQDLREGWHCMRCEKAMFERSRRLADKAAQIRGRAR